MIFTTVLLNEEAESLRRVTTLSFFSRRTRKFRFKPAHRERDVCLMDNLATLPDVKLETQRLTRTVGTPTFWNTEEWFCNNIRTESMDDYVQIESS